MKAINRFSMKTVSRSANESFVRTAVAAFAAQLDPTVEDISDVKTAVSEAVTNCIVHAYRDLPDGQIGYVYISVRLYDSREISVEISDRGRGIANVDQAMHPGFTTGGASDRCGMGFLVMQSFTDSLHVKSAPGRGTTVLMRKFLSPISERQNEA